MTGFHGDLNETYPVGEIDEESKGLIRTTRESLDAAIKLCKPGALFRDLGKAMLAILLPVSSLKSYPHRPHKENQWHARMDVRLFERIQATGSITSSIVPQMCHIMPKIKQSER